jgi:hypothetical protein
VLINKILLVLVVQFLGARHLLVELLVQLLNELFVLRLKLLYLVLEILLGSLEGVRLVLGRVILNLLNAVRRRLVKVINFVLVLFFQSGGC